MWPLYLHSNGKPQHEKCDYKLLVVITGNKTNEKYESEISLQDLVFYQNASGKTPVVTRKNKWFTHNRQLSFPEAYQEV